MNEKLPVLTCDVSCIIDSFFRRVPPHPPGFKVGSQLWTPWCAVNMLPVNIDLGGKGGHIQEIQIQNFTCSLDASRFLLATFLPSTAARSFGVQ